MSSATRPPSLRSIFAHGLCAPMILLERSRGIWRLGLVVLHGLIAVVGVGYSLRSRNLARVPDLEQVIHAEQTRQARLIVALAEQLYVREHGQSPSSPRVLVGTYRESLPEGYVDPAHAEKAASPRRRGR